MHRLLKKQREHGRTDIAARTATAAAPVTATTARPERTEAAAETTGTEPARSKATGTETTRPVPTRTKTAATAEAGARIKTSTRPEATTLVHPAVCPPVTAVVAVIVLVMPVMITLVPVVVSVSPTLATHASHRCREGRPPVAETPGARSKSTIC
ncbi:hypothetical protein [Fodinicola feengrottensis]|uniref:Uncharacterized protein n=1 Tax=Fodinicola feengrottensis TaxID=435914 RepID=A0ABP4UF33_9ACTN